MSDEPSIAVQLNSILEYLNYHGHIFLKIASNHDSDEVGEKQRLIPTLQT
ncbi:MAG: hypothetical protein ACFFDC_16625 [Promethearchaeota archaeon]